MNLLTLVILIWGLLATAACLFIHGATMDDQGPRAQWERMRAAWRMHH